MQISMFSSEERPASPSQSPAFAKEWLTQGVIWPSPFLRLLTSIAPSGWFGRTSPECFPHTAGEISVPSSGGWQNSGMGGPTEFWTLGTSEWPRDAAVGSLSETPED